MRTYFSIFTLLIIYSVSAVCAEHYLVTVKNIDQFLSGHKNLKFEDLNLQNMNVLRVKASEEEIQQINTRSPQVIRVERDIKLELLQTDSLFPKQWHLENTGLNSRTTVIVPGVKGEDVDAKKAWEITTGSKNIKVALIDSGVDYNHPDLAPNIWINDAEKNGVAGIDDDNNGYIDDIHGYDFINEDNDPLDEDGHGSHCAGILGASHNNVGIMGVSGNVQIMALKFSSQGAGTMASALKAVDYAIEAKADIMSNSWGGAPAESVLFDLLKKASENGMFISNAAGNSANNSERFPIYPASYDIPGLMSVGATMGRGSRTRFSNFGKTAVDVFAPGQNIFSSWMNGRYKKKSGTSMSAPIVAGMAVLALSINPDLTPEKLKSIIIESSEMLPELKDLAVGGRVNAYQMLELIQ